MIFVRYTGEWLLQHSHTASTRRSFDEWRAGLDGYIFDVGNVLAGVRSNGTTTVRKARTRNRCQVIETHLERGYSFPNLIGSAPPSASICWLVTQGLPWNYMQLHRITWTAQKIHRLNLFVLAPCIASWRLWRDFLQPKAHLPWLFRTSLHFPKFHIKYTEERTNEPPHLAFQTHRFWGFDQK